jgi:hypothetical protein
MTRRRDLRLKDKYSISTKRYRELFYFCLQYPEWQNELEFLTDSLKSPELSGMPHGTEKSDTTANLAIRRAELSKKCELIKQTALEADSEIYQYIIKNVTTDYAGYNYLRTVLNMPCGREKFYKSRRRFFYLLDKK